MSALQFTEVRKSYGPVDVISDINLEISQGEFIVFVGPSGCGKSTLLRMIAGLESIDSGSISIDGRVVNDVPPAQRAIAMVFQSYALYPHMSVRDNMSFGLRMAKMSKREIDRRVDAAAAMLQLLPLLDRLPKQLSGGQRQRVAIGRAITRDPKIFLFDEPLSNLDAALRVATRIEIARLKQSMPQTTMIYVTHDQVEAMTLADRIVVMRGGNIEQVGTALDLYHRPLNKFVAGFIGSPAMNFIDVTQTGQGSIKTMTGDELNLVGRVGIDVPASLGVRPEDLTVTDGPAVARGTVSLVENLGEFSVAYIEIGSPEPLTVKLAGNGDVELGDTVSFGCPIDKIHLFDEAGQALRSS